MSGSTKFRTIITGACYDFFFIPPSPTLKW
jgi:hypothetical protein